MKDEGLPKEVETFLIRYIESVAQLETLLLLQSRTGQAYAAEDISAELRIDPTAAAQQLAGLCKNGLLVCSGDPHPLYRFEPRGPEIGEIVTQLARAYADRRVSVISLIYSRPPDTIRLFADAFRIRKEKRDDR